MQGRGNSICLCGQPKVGWKNLHARTCAGKSCATDDAVARALSCSACARRGTRRWSSWTPSGGRTRIWRRRLRTCWTSWARGDAPSTSWTSSAGGYRYSCSKVLTLTCLLERSRKVGTWQRLSQTYSAHWFVKDLALSSLETHPPLCSQLFPFHRSKKRSFKPLSRRRRPHSNRKRIRCFEPRWKWRR